MNCKEIQNMLPGFVDGSLDNALHESIANHINNCKDCNEELDKMVRLENVIGKMTEVEVPDHVNTFFSKAIEKEKKQIGRTIHLSIPTNHPIFRIAASIILIVTGVLIGYNLRPKQDKTELASLQKEITEMKSLVVFSMLRQESASERIKAVSYVNEISNPDPKLVETLINTLNTDRNVNVRLAAAQALSRYKDNKAITDLLIKSLGQQSEPLVQIMLINLAVEEGGANAKMEITRLLQRIDLNQEVKTYTEKKMKSISL